MNEYSAIFLEAFNNYDPFDAWCESTVMSIYARMNGDAYIAEESFSEKVKNGFDKVCETISNWIGKVKEFLKTIKKWIVDHAKLLWAKLNGKKEVQNVADPKDLEEASNKLSEAAKVVQMAAQQPETEHKAEESIKAATAAVKQVFAKKQTVQMDANAAVKRIDNANKTAEKALDVVNQVRKVVRNSKSNWIRGNASILIKQAAGIVKKVQRDINKIIGNEAKAATADYEDLMGGNDEDDFEGVPV